MDDKTKNTHGGARAGAGRKKKEVKAKRKGKVVYFRILDDESWIVYALEINGKPDTTDNIAEDLYNLYLLATEAY